jgi:hypothetical protein
VKKTRKLLDKLADILSAERQAQQAKYTSLKKVLKSLRAEKTRLKEQLALATDEESRQEIESRLKVVSMQRKKGLGVLKELKKERKQQQK